MVFSRKSTKRHFFLADFVEKTLDINNYKKYVIVVDGVIIHESACPFPSSSKNLLKNILCHAGVKGTLDTRCTKRGEAW